MNVELIVWIIIGIGLWELLYWNSFRKECSGYFFNKLFSGMLGTVITGILFLLWFMIKDTFKDFIIEPKYFIIPSLIVGVFVINYLIEQCLDKGYDYKIKRLFRRRK